MCMYKPAMSGTDVYYISSAVKHLFDSQGETDATQWQITTPEYVIVLVTYLHIKVHILLVPLNIMIFMNG